MQWRKWRKIAEGLAIQIGRNKLEVTCHESSNKKITKGKTTISTNILTEIYRGRDH